jgi:threonine/homoserine efflux transporter RhtA
MSTRLRARNVLMVLLGVTVLLAKGWFAKSLGDLAYSYLGNLAVSFAIYFLVSLAAGDRQNRFMMAVIGLLVVEVFEFADGFKIMTNVYDPFDYLANALGVALAVLVDALSTRLIRANSENP